MNKTITIDGELDRIFGSDARSFYAEHQDAARQIKPVNPLAEATPAPWATPNHDGAEL